MQEDLSVMEDLTLSPQDKKDLQMDMKTGMLGLYCNQCEECLPQCPKNLDIPTYMRSYMYVYGYRNLQAAREALDSVALAGAVPCWSCSTCTVTCAQGFDVKRRVEDVVRLKQVPCEFLG
jgi:predicted aldo/keto reductase-like oxidoreductase